MTIEPMQISAVTLKGTHVRLVPPDFKYENDLVKAAQPREIWEFIATAPGQTPAEMHAWIQQAIDETANGSRIWFIIIRKSDGCAIGATSYMDIHRSNRGLEIGGTWVTPSAWRTPINTECKYLLLRHAFENLGCLRVQLKTDLRNVRSQKAIERLGAVKEGVLRKHMITRTGYIRDTVMYSIIDTEWQAVKEKLEGFLKQRPLTADR
ncbi:MAG: GNAT family N-acetyltransferase [Chloroflexi bacterium]|nr:GNAT family N-acetyltransferase [Chloroflexota bacterium]